MKIIEKVPINHWEHEIHTNQLKNTEIDHEYSSDLAQVGLIIDISWNTFYPIKKEKCIIEKINNLHLIANNWIINEFSLNQAQVGLIMDVPSVKSETNVSL